MLSRVVSAVASGPAGLANRTAAAAAAALSRCVWTRSDNGPKRSVGRAVSRRKHPAASAGLRVAPPEHSKRESERASNFLVQSKQNQGVRGYAGTEVPQRGADRHMLHLSPASYHPPFRL